MLTAISTAEVVGPESGSSALPIGKTNLEDWTEEDIAQFARSMVSGPNYTPGNMLAQSASPHAAENQLGLDEQWFAHMVRALQIGAPIDMSPIAVDSIGQIDVEHGNPGPEISPKGQLTFSPYAHLLNSDEIESKKTKERKRTLQSMPLHPPKEADDNDPGDLWFERETLSRRSSVSSVSAVSDMGQPSDEYPLCKDDCWLRRELQPHDSGLSVSGERVKSLSTPVGIYEPLKSGETRVLRIQPTPKGQSISCELKTVQIPIPRENPVQLTTYDALSYCWGTMKPDHQIFCNNLLFPVTANLYSALAALRSSTEVKQLWVDAVCIDQQNIDERNQQVGQMLSIYKGARSVVVWLGDTAENSSIAIEGFKHLDSYERRMSVFMHSHTHKCYSNLRAMYEAQVALFNRSWFRRSWIRQEITVSKTCLVRCGGDELTWYQLKRGANRLKRVHQKLDREGETTLPHFPKSCIEPLQYLVRGWVFGQPVISESAEIRSIWYYHAGSLLDLLMVGRAFNATDPRDKIYSVLGLAKVPIVESNSAPPDTNPMVVDYSKTTSEVYQYLAKYIINRDRNLDILCILLTHRNAESADLPTWVPDWRVPTDYAKLLDCWDFFASKFAASGFTKAEIQDQSNVGKLLVKGLCLYQVEQLLDYTTFVPRGADVPYAPLEPFDKNVHLRRLCQTAAGGTGLVPRNATSEDLIFILYGTKLPFVLRPVEFRNGKEEGIPEFEVVGPCWVPQYMFGRVMKELGDRPDAEWFHMYLI